MIDVSISPNRQAGGKHSFGFEVNNTWSFALLALKPMFDALSLVRGVVVTNCLLYDLGVGFRVSELLRYFHCPVSYTPAIDVTVCYTYNVRLQRVSVGSIHY